jgi:hypothetical protein
MSATPGSNTPPFVVHTKFDQPELLGASWWQERLQAAAGGGSAPDRRQAVKALLIMGGVATLGLGFVVTQCSDSRGSRSQTALALQQSQGLTVNATGVPFAFVDQVANACDGSLVDDAVMRSLAATLRPARTELQPFYVPTLFQALTAPSADSLRASIRPMHNAAMERAEARGAAVRELLTVLEKPTSLMLVVDLPGPESLAFAAGLAPQAEVVCSLDNWPHPRGVVPSHLTLAAALYYAPRLAQTPRDALQRSLCMVLDRNRLLPYANEPERFDNRYLAKLPDAKALRELGVERILYVAAEGAPAEEADDLNDEFVAYRKAGLVVQMLGAGDLRPAEPGVAANSKDATNPSGGNRHYWFGNPMYHWFFWNHFGARHRAGPVTGIRPPGSIFGAGYQPVPRVSPFTGRPPGGIGLMPGGGSSSSRSRSGSGSRSRSSGFTGS